jgi:hypothetical protein
MVTPLFLQSSFFFLAGILTVSLALKLADSNENSCGPVGPGSDITSKSGFFASLFEWEPREDDFRTNRSW